MDPVPDPNKTMKNDTKEPVMPTKTPSKKKSCKKPLRISWRRYKKWLTKVCKMHSSNFKTPKIKNMRRHRIKYMKSEVP
jgi:hypothetical protein